MTVIQVYVRDRRNENLFNYTIEHFFFFFFFFFFVYNISCTDAKDIQ